MSTSRVKVPQFDSVKKPYKRYREEIEYWQLITKIEEKERAVHLAYELPDQDPSDIKDKLFVELGKEQLHCNDGVKNFLDYMDKLFKVDDLAEHYDEYVKFDSFKRKKDQHLSDFINEFEKLHNVVKKRDMTLPQTILAFKLIDAAGLSDQDRKFVLTGIDYTKKESLYEQTKVAIRKFAGLYATSSSSSSSGAIEVKVEPAFNALTLHGSADIEETLAAHGFYRKNNKDSKKFSNFRGRGRYKGGSSDSNARGSYRNVEKRINPVGDSGDRLICPSCGSYRHLLKDCPDSYENMNKKSEHRFADKENVEDALLANLGLLGLEAGNKGIIDSGCTSTVCGKEWLDTYIDTLNKDEKSKVVWKDSEKWFKFGGGELLKSLNQVNIPCVIGGKKVKLGVEVVDSHIPLLLSSDTLKKADAILDLGNERISLYGQWSPCDRTSSGLFVIDLGKSEVPLPIHDVLVALDKDSNDLKYLLKLHRQFGHLSEPRFRQLLVSAGRWKDKYVPAIKNLYENCKTCKLFAKSSPRPVVALPAAAEFSEVLTMDLKECDYSAKHKYILHLIDAFTRFSVSVFIPRKHSVCIVDAIFKRWIAVFERPKRIWSDLGGEFNNKEMKEMSEALGIELGTGGAYAPWMNGLCERNHQTIDRCLEKIMYDNPQMDVEVALVWANNARNTMKVCNGFSPHQLVFGKNPTLPSVTEDKLPALNGLTTSKTVGEHINALHEARKAFIGSECDERIRRALRHNVRAVEEFYVTGDKVYYRQDAPRKKNNLWHGPATVTGCVGSVAFIEHQGSMYRVPTCRLQHVGNEYLQKGSCDADSVEKQNVVHVESGKSLDQSKSVEYVEKSVEANQSASVQDAVTETTMGPAEVEQSSSSENVVTEIATASNNDVPNKNDGIQYKLNEDAEWQGGVVLSRAGKQTSKFGQNKYCVNVQPANNPEPICVDLNKVFAWEYLPVEDVNVVAIPEQYQDSNECLAAKQKELSAFRTFDVYDEVPDDGQFRVSTTWVLSKKMIEGSLGVKARLVARGFEETSPIKSDSPTCTQDAFRIFLAIAVSKNWVIECTDIKSAFLQGKQLAREVFVQPPKEAGVKGVLWHLKKCMYGLQDASRMCFLNVAEVLQQLNCKQIGLDLSVYVYENNSILAGVFLVHVDDFLHIGNKRFYTQVVCKLRMRFKVGSMSKQVLSYIGLEIDQSQASIGLSQIKYIATISIQGLPANRKLQKEERLSKEEHCTYRRLVGQLNWVARHTRPDIVFDVMELSTALNKPCIRDYARLVKTVKKLKYSDVGVIFPNLGELQNWYLLVMADAGYANLCDSVSSAAGYVIFLVGDGLKCIPLCWKANKIQRKVNSTLAAEALALRGAVDHAILLRNLLKDMLCIQLNFPVEAWTDSRNAFTAVQNSTQVADKRLRIDIAYLKDCVAGERVSVNWCPGKEMLANCMTKTGCSSDDLLHVISTGCLVGHYKGKVA